jgi:hypothetical protein
MMIAGLEEAGACHWLARKRGKTMMEARVLRMMMLTRMKSMMAMMVVRVGESMALHSLCHRLRTRLARLHLAPAAAAQTAHLRQPQPPGQMQRQEQTKCHTQA